MLMLHIYTQLITNVDKMAILNMQGDKINSKTKVSRYEVNYFFKAKFQIV